MQKLEQSIAQNVSLPDRDPWIRHVRQARAAAQVLGLPEHPRVSFESDPKLRYWDPVSYNKAMPRGIHAPRTRWSVEGNGVKHYPGRAQDYLYLRTPLRGDFDVSCDLTSFGWREAHLGYGGLRFDLLHTLKRYNFIQF